ncbi:MAG: phosphoglycerate kinase [Chitinivibrionales bacterium]|nr:phosphoglycerate kinase [Chitinivibrionales bacterium]
MKKAITEAGDLSGKRVLVRADLSVPLHEGKITDDTRLRVSLPTLEFLLVRRARVILCSHLDRPKGRVRNDLRFDGVCGRLSDLLGVAVQKAEDCVGDEARSAVERLQPGNVLLLENTRFHPGEESNDPAFARQLADLADIFVNDAFACAHREHASTVGVARLLPSYAGMLMQQEMQSLTALLQHPEHPYVAIMGGTKITDKLGAIEHLLPQVDTLLVGGTIASTLLKAKGVQVGASTVDRSALDDARRLIELAGKKLVLPVDVMASTDVSTHASAEMYPVEYMPLAVSIVDIGPETRALFRRKLEGAVTVVWNGPLGICEFKRFAQGTLDILNKLAAMKAKVVVGGGDTTAVVQQAGKAEALSHVSTGGAAFLRFLQGEELPAIAALRDERVEAVGIGSSS